MKAPKITAIVPLYNRENYIEETMDSIINQDFSDFELIIIDDGSTDGSKDRIIKYLTDKRVKYFYQKNSGEAEAVNKGWSLAKGTYFIQINSDDPILPGLFEEMYNTLEANPDYLLAYPDFYFIDHNGKRIKEIKNPDWNYLEALSDYSCYASSPGVFIRRSAFKDLAKIKDKRFLHISDNYMYFHMGLRGKFLHVPKFLAVWREHAGSISAKRYKSIPEIQVFFNEFYSQKSLPDEVLDCKDKTRRSMLNYFNALIDQSNLSSDEKLKEKVKVNEWFMNSYKFKNLQVGDNDLIGNKFNGHDLHKYLRNRDIDSSHLVWNKESNDEDTYILAGEKADREVTRVNIRKIQAEYALNNILGPVSYDILYNRLFLEADIVHLHLLNNLDFDIQLLPLLTHLKPVVWTIHDPWVLSGHCIQHFDCDRWLDGCGDCPYLQVPFAMDKDTTALNYYIKSNSLINSDFEVVVASNYMRNLLIKSPIFKNKNINVIPFGINQNIFKPLDRTKIRAKFKISNDVKVLLFRNDNPEKKGIDYIEYALQKMDKTDNVEIITFGSTDWKCPKNYKITQMGWIKDDVLMSELYNIADLFLMPSTQESFGMMAIEAMSCGILPIVLEGTALPETVKSENCGVAVKRDKDEYYRTVKYYLENDIKRNERAIKCLSYAKETYNKDLYIEKIIKIYNDAMTRFETKPKYLYILQQIEKYAKIEPVKTIRNNQKTVGIIYKDRHIKNPVKKLLKKFLRILPHYRKLIQIEEETAANYRTLSEIDNKVNSIIDSSKIYGK